MSEEIKEILENLQRLIDRKCYPEDVIDSKVCITLLDYITNLQEKEKIFEDLIYKYDELKEFYDTGSTPIRNISKAYEILTGGGKE